MSVSGFTLATDALSVRDWEARRKANFERKQKALHEKLLANAGLDERQAHWLPKYKEADKFRIPSNAQHYYKDFLKRHKWDDEYNWVKPKERKGPRHAAIDRFNTGDEDYIDKMKRLALPEGCTRRDEVICLIRDIPIKKVSESQRPITIGSAIPPGKPPDTWKNTTPLLKSKGGEDFFPYNGEWENGKMCGRGTLTFALGGEYKGAMRDNRQNGYGETQYEATGGSYKGEWANGLFGGLGTLDYGNGIVYTGHFEKGQRHGKGKLVYPSGQEYDGDWANGLQHGRGTMKNKWGHKYVGSWQKGQVAGSGTFFFPDGERLVRFWPPRTFMETLQAIRTEKREAKERRAAELEELQRPIRERLLLEYVEEVRNDIEEEERRKKEEEEAELRRMLIDKREKQKQAKIEAIEAAMAAEGRADDAGE